MAEITDSHVILSLGAGVQSTALALMAVRGELPGFRRPVAAIFADTGWEPRGVYDHLHWLVQELGEALPVHIVADRHPDGTPANTYADTLALVAYRRERAPGLPSTSRRRANRTPHSSRRADTAHHSSRSRCGRATTSLARSGRCAGNAPGPTRSRPFTGVRDNSSRDRHAFGRPGRRLLRCGLASRRRSETSGVSRAASRGSPTVGDLNLYDVARTGWR